MATKNREDNLKFRTTEEIEVPKSLAEQVIGQDAAVEVIKKAARQRRHVLLIGEPGTGKSLVGQALAEELPMEKQVDILCFPNQKDENAPIIKTVPAGQGRRIVDSLKLSALTGNGNQWIYIILIFVAIFAASTVLDWIVGAERSDILKAADRISGTMFLIILFFGAMIFYTVMKMQLGRKKIVGPKLIVDNSELKHAPFIDATGLHEGALLGDVSHDPFQTFFGNQKLSVKSEIITNTEIKSIVEGLLKKYNDKVLKKEKNNYEAVLLPENELLVFGETNGFISPVGVLSSNRYDYNGEMIRLKTSMGKEIIVTPEHKIAIWKDNKIVYVEAKNVNEDDDIIINSDIIIDEQDIINTYDCWQREQCKLYYQYLKIKAQNSTWGYKRIANAMGKPISKTRWWHEDKHMPVPIRTVNWLKKKGLLPLKIDNPKLPLIAKIIGATFGDGGVFDNLNGIFLSSKEIEAVKEFGEDFKKIFGNDVEINHRVIEGGEYGHSWCYQNTNRKIIRLFLALGAPKGNKGCVNLEVPNWIKLKDAFEDEFFGSFLGGNWGPLLYINMVIL